MKLAWVHLENWSDELAVAAIESGADALVLPGDAAPRAVALGRIAVVVYEPDGNPQDDIRFESLSSAKDEARIADLLRAGRTVIITPFRSGRNSARSWEVIPIENLIAAGGGSLLLPVGFPGDIDLALGVLEKGVTGVVISSPDPSEIRAMVAKVKKLSESEPLRTARITGISHAGLGDRVCVDTCTLMEPGEGMLVGNSSAFLFLVQAETEEGPYVAPRPFRINAGPVHSYVRVPGGATCYLSELKAGKRVLRFRPDGTSEESTVGRVKIERRPLVLIEAEYEGRPGTVLLQNAETIRLTRPGGEAVSVAKLKTGDSVLIAVEQAGRHFGMKVDETIHEI